jgi:hypothetical protein
MRAINRFLRWVREEGEELDAPRSVAEAAEAVHGRRFSLGLGRMLHPLDLVAAKDALAEA